MSDDLMAAKQRVGSFVLGKHGIHGVGVSLAERSVVLYVSPDGDSDLPNVLTQLQQLAAPFSIRLVEERRPSVS